MLDTPVTLLAESQQAVIQLAVLTVKWCMYFWVNTSLLWRDLFWFFMIHHNDQINYCTLCVSLAIQTKWMTSHSAKQWTKRKPSQSHCSSWWNWALTVCLCFWGQTINDKSTPHHSLSIYIIKDESGMKGQRREIRNKGPQPDSNQGDSWTLKPLGDPLNMVLML